MTGWNDTQQAAGVRAVVPGLPGRGAADQRGGHGGGGDGRHDAGISRRRTGWRRARRWRYGGEIRFVTTVINRDDGAVERSVYDGAGCGIGDGARRARTCRRRNCRARASSTTGARRRRCSRVLCGAAVNRMEVRGERRLPRVPVQRAGAGSAGQQQLHRRAGATERAFRRSRSWARSTTRSCRDTWGRRGWEVRRTRFYTITNATVRAGQRPGPAGEGVRVERAEVAFRRGRASGDGWISACTNWTMKRRRGCTRRRGSNRRCR